jgi:DNA-binding transcriptional MerR regulator
MMKPLKRTPSTPIYGIGAASRLSGLAIYTLRWIESRGLLAPRRTPGKHRLFSEDDIERLNAIRGLMDRKVNLPGIRIILDMRKTGSRLKY